VAIKELAANLQITDDNNWKKFAQHIGFTRSEIKSKLQVRMLISNKSHQVWFQPSVADYIMSWWWENAATHFGCANANAATT
jgi:hypothetical protein